MNKLARVSLASEEQAKLLELLGEEGIKRTTIRRIHILLSLDEGYTAEQIAKALYINPSTVEWVCEKFAEGGLEYALNI